jgi:hypothetical protein
MSWNHRVKIKHLLTEDETHEAVQTDMSAIADVLDGNSLFILFNTQKFRNIPKGDEVFGPVDYANRLLNELYDFADDMRIWIE